MNNHDYTNELIQIFEYQSKLLFETNFVGLWWTQAEIGSIYYANVVLLVAMETVQFHIAQMPFFLRMFFALMGPSKNQFGTHEKLGVECKIG